MKEKYMKEVYAKIKKIVDPILALFLLIILLPLMLIIAISIKLNSKGPIIFTHKRIGKNGKEFKLYKFRTMCINAEEKINGFSQVQKIEWHEKCKLRDDPRVTKIGKILRTTGLDELPQLINIIKGELSLIGPRPITKDEIKRYGNTKEKLVSVTPGLTGYWQAYSNDNTTYDERIKMELYYVDKMSLVLDIKIFFKTFKTILVKSRNELINRKNEK